MVESRTRWQLPERKTRGGVVMKGIVLAGGSGTRLYPVTKGISKQLLPIYDKPMVYYPLSVLMLAGITDILIITTPEDQDSFKRLLGTGEELGISLSYVIQPSPDGLAQAFILGENFIGNDDVCLVLGDNIYYGHDLTNMLLSAVKNTQVSNSAMVFGYHVNDPNRYGVIEFDTDNNVISLEEKPQKPKSNYAVTGLYFYPNDVIKKAKEVKPSDRGELEITSVNQLYLNEGRLKVKLMGRGFAWLDTGTHNSLLEASAFIETIENRQGLKVSCLEEIAFDKGYITKDQLIKLAEPLKKNQYGQYLLRRAEEGCV
jgi:glucose-1-phosphate thymidylyltransferase